MANLAAAAAAAAARDPAVDRSLRSVFGKLEYNANLFDSVNLEKLFCGKDMVFLDSLAS